MTEPQTIKSGILELRLDFESHTRVMYIASTDVQTRVRKLRSILRLDRPLPSRVLEMTGPAWKMLQIKLIELRPVPELDDRVLYLEEIAKENGWQVWHFQSEIKTTVVYDRQYKPMFDGILQAMEDRELTAEQVLTMVQTGNY